MVNSKDRFWRFFVLAVLVFASATAIAAFTGDVWESGDIPLDIPIATTTPRVVFQLPERPAPVFTGTLYDDRLFEGAEDWSWDTVSMAAPTALQFDASPALSVSILKQWGAYRLALKPLPANAYQALEFSIRGPNTLTITLFDASGNELGSQPLAWYDDASADTWRVVRIPFSNLGALGRSVSGVSWSASTPVQFYLDDIHFTQTVVAHDPAPPQPTSDESIVFTNSNLPYSFAFIEAEKLLWYAPYGQFAVSDALTIGSNKETGFQSLAVYKRGANWTDYTATADVTMRGESVSLLARYKTDSDYVTCAFNNRATRVQIYRALGQRYDVIAETPELGNWYLGPRYTFSIHVTGNRVECLINGERALAATLSLNPTGTVAIGTWSAQPGVYATTVHSFTVTEN